MQHIKLLTSLIVALPLLSSMIAGLLHRRLSRSLVAGISCLFLKISFLLSCYVTYSYFSSEKIPLTEYLYEWASVGNLQLNIGFQIDSLTCIMMLVVTFVSLMVHIYSIGYMSEHSGFKRFFCYISFFTFAMLMLVVADNFLQLFFAWEAVGLASYLLIGFWYTKPTAIFANLKAFLINRIADLGFLLGIAAIYSNFGSLQYQDVLPNVANLAQNYPNTVHLIAILLFIGAMGKSAQVPFHVWLPDSMEGPTPISALIHAATMVTAGVFLLARMSPIFELSEIALSLALIIGTITMLSMGVLAIVQSDIKKIIAYSTLSQLGYMMIASGVSAYSIAIFHLFTHAFFKALLFLSAGSVIIALHHEQNIFKMGALAKKLPITHLMMLIGTLAIVGIPGTSGFYSKEAIVQAVEQSSLSISTPIYYLTLLGILITSLYSFRLLFVVFYGKSRVNYDNNIKEPPKTITAPLMALAIPSLFIGGILFQVILSSFFDDSIFVTQSHKFPHHEHGLVAVFLHGLVSVPLLLVIIGATIMWYTYLKKPNIPDLIKSKIRYLYIMLEAKYGFDSFNEKVIAKSVREISRILWKIGDVFGIDGVIVNGTAKVISKISSTARLLQTGYVFHYTFAVMTGVFILIMWLLIMH